VRLPTGQGDAGQIRDADGQDVPMAFAVPKSSPGKILRRMLKTAEPAVKPQNRSA
jgi:hypothetical protein